MVAGGAWQFGAALITAALLLNGCDRGGAASAPAHGKPPTVVSLVPSATDLLLGMGAGDHLVGVSNLDQDPRVASLPRVGDYQSIDWEKLAQLKPNVIVTFYGNDRTPAGFVERAGKLHLRQVNLNFERLDHVYAALAVLGSTCNESDKSVVKARQIRREIESLRHRTSELPRVRAIIVTDPSGLSLAGRSTFLNDLLQVAGGENAVESMGYVTLDREALAAMKPDVVLDLLPGADARALARSASFWQSLPELPAVKNHRVCLLTEDYVMLPGSHVAETARLFTRALHPELDRSSTHPDLDGPTTAPTTRADP